MLLFPVQSDDGTGYDLKIAIEPQMSMASLFSMMTISTSLGVDQQPYAIISALVGDSLIDQKVKVWVRANQRSARTSDFASKYFSFFLGYGVCINLFICIFCRHIISKYCMEVVCLINMHLSTINLFK